MGIPREHLQTLFDPYFTTKQEGNGLGLASSYSIVKNHGGHLIAYSELGKGSVFRMYLPALPEGEFEEQQAPTELITGSGPVLVMDDDDLVQGLAKRMLERLGYDVEMVKNGEAAGSSSTKPAAGQRPLPGRCDGSDDHRQDGWGRDDRETAEP